VVYYITVIYGEVEDDRDNGSILRKAITLVKLSVKAAG
jgi:hypothetical protein